MADNDERGEVVPRGNEWEVVSLTASAYAAAPGPEQFESSLDDGKKMSEESIPESSISMFMSGHFVFPPSQHENLPVEPAYNDKRGVEFDTTTAHEGGDESEEIMKPTEFSSTGPEFDETISFRSHVDKPDTIERGSDVVEPDDDDSADPAFSESSVGRKLDGDDSPSECWLKKKAISFYSTAKETNTFSSVFVAAAVMGLVIIGHRWQQEKWQVLHLRHFAPNERTIRILGPIYRLKDVVVGGYQRGLLLRGAAASSNEGR